MYDGGAPALWYDGSHRLTNRLLSGGAVDRIMADEQMDVGNPYSPGALSWLLHDHEGSVRDVVDNSGGVLKHVKYDSFGNVVSAANAAPLFAYAGQYRDPKTGLQLHGARWYDPATGRFLSEDPSGLGPDANPYRYCGNAPLDNVDPTGLCYTGVSNFFSSLGSAFGSTAMSYANSWANYVVSTAAAIASPFLLGPVVDPSLGLQRPANQQSGNQAVVPRGHAPELKQVLNAAVAAAGGPLEMTKERYWSDFNEGIKGYFVDAPFAILEGVAKTGYGMLTDPGTTTLNLIRDTLSLPSTVYDVMMNGDARQQAGFFGQLVIGSFGGKYLGGTVGPHIKNAAPKAFELLKKVHADESGQVNFSLALGKAPTEWTAPAGWRLPANKGQWSGTAGNSMWKSTNKAINKITGNKPIPFKEGYIDLSDYTYARYEFKNLTGNKTDFKIADKKFAADMGFRSADAARTWRSNNKLTWHHLEDGNTLQLVPTVLNDIPHQGGASILKGK